MTTAAACLPVPVLTVVVLDACDDDSASLAGQFGTDVHFVLVDPQCRRRPRGRVRLCPVAVQHRPGTDVVRHHRRRHPGRSGLAAEADGLGRRHGPRRGADTAVAALSPPRWPGATSSSTTRKGRATTTSTAPTWAFAPTVIGRSAVFAAGHRRGRRPGRSVRRRGHAHPPRREALGGDSDRRTGRAPAASPTTCASCRRCSGGRRVSRLTAGLVGQWLASGALNLPLPGSVRPPAMAHLPR